MLPRSPRRWFCYALCERHQRDKGTRYQSRIPHTTWVPQRKPCTQGRKAPSEAAGCFQGGMPTGIGAGRSTGQA